MISFCSSSSELGTYLCLTRQRNALRPLLLVAAHVCQTSYLRTLSSEELPLCCSIVIAGREQASIRLVSIYRTECLRYGCRIPVHALVSFRKSRSCRARWSWYLSCEVRGLRSRVSD